MTRWDAIWRYLDGPLSRRQAWIVLSAFVLLLGIGAAQHEMWRDEVRAWSIATAGPNVLSIFGNLRNEGHPVLWYLALRTATAALEGSRLALPITSALIAVGAVWLFVRHAPFPAWVRVLFPFGYFPLYEYSVMSRNYGISMLLLFAICIAWRERWNRPLVLGCLLALLAETNVHSVILVGALMLAWVIDARELLNGTPDGKKVLRPSAFTAGLLIAAVGMGGCILVALPDASTTVTDAMAPQGFALRDAGLGLLRPGFFLHAGFFPELFPAVSSWLELPTLAALILIAWCLRHRPAILLAFLAALVGFLILFSVVYFGRARHQGLLFVFVLALLWIDQPHESRSNADRVRLPLGRTKVILLALLLSVHVLSGIEALVTDVRDTRTGAPELAHLVASRPEYANAVILGEPDFLLETFPYYMSNSLYVVREGRFERWTHFTKASAPTLTLAQLLDAADDIRARYRRPVLLYFGKGNPVEELARRISGTRADQWFSWDAAERQRLLGSATYLGYIPSQGTDEHYHVFGLAAPPAVSTIASPGPLPAH